MTFPALDHTMRASSTMTLPRAMGHRGWVIKRPRIELNNTEEQNVNIMKPGNVLLDICT